MGTPISKVKKGDTVMLCMFTGLRAGPKEVIACDSKTITIMRNGKGESTFDRKTGKLIKPKPEKGKERFASFITEDDGTFVHPMKDTKVKKKRDKAAAKKKAKATPKKAKPEPEDEDEEIEIEEEAPAPKKTKKKPAPKKKPEPKPEPEEDEFEDEDDDDFDDDDFEEVE